MNKNIFLFIILSMAQHLFATQESNGDFLQKQQSDSEENKSNFVHNDNEHIQNKNKFIINQIAQGKITIEEPKNTSKISQEELSKIAPSLRKFNKKLEFKLQAIQEAQNKKTQKNIKKFGLVLLSALALELLKPILEPISPVGYQLVRNAGYAYLAFESIKSYYNAFQPARKEVRIKSRIYFIHKALQENQ
jgi:hypothetical protein